MIKVATCNAPVNVARQLRQIDEHFVKTLKKHMIHDPAAPGVSPLALLCVDVQDVAHYKLHLKNQYSYEVLGGLHSITAKKQLMDEMPGLFSSSKNEEHQ